MAVFEASDVVVKIGPSIDPNQPNEVKLVQINEMYIMICLIKSMAKRLKKYLDDVAGGFSWRSGRVVGRDGLGDERAPAASGSV